MMYATATLSAESFHANDYSVAVKTETFEDPVDLSCKKVPSPHSPVTSESDKDSSVSPLRGSTYLEHHEETNNNDSKSLSSYHLHIRAQRQRKNLEKDAEKERQSQTHLYHHHHDPTSCSNSNHERKSPYENPPYVMTPPSDTSSPKKSKYYSMLDQASPGSNSISSSSTSSSSSETQPYPSYPILPVALGGSVPVPVPSPVNRSSITPGPTTPNSMPHSPIATSASPQEPARTSTPVDDSKKAPRPFKAYPKDPLSISTMGPDMIFDQEQKQAYREFRNRMLESVKRSNEGTNIKMRRMSKSPMPPTSALDDKDAAYWERRRKNNEAAKRSRDARRAKEDEIAIRAAFLEQEFLRLKYENSLLKEENIKLSKLVYGS